MAVTLTIANSCGVALTIDLHPYAAMPLALQQFLEDRCAVKITSNWSLAHQQLARRFPHVPRGAGIIDITQLTGGAVDQLVQAPENFSAMAAALWGLTLPAKHLLAPLQRHTSQLCQVVPLTYQLKWTGHVTASWHLALSVMDMELTNFAPNHIQLGQTVDPVLIALRGLMRMQWLLERAQVDGDRTADLNPLQYLANQTAVQHVEPEKAWCYDNYRTLLGVYLLKVRGNPAIYLFPPLDPGLQQNQIFPTVHEMVNESTLLLPQWLPFYPTEAEARQVVRAVFATSQAKSYRWDVTWMEEVRLGIGNSVVPMDPLVMRYHTWGIRHQAGEIAAWMDDIRALCRNMEVFGQRMRELRQYKDKGELLPPEIQEQ